MDELVKKADVIDCLRIGKDESIEISRRGIKKYILGVCRKIKQLPTVQSERGQGYMMDDLISRQAAIEAIGKDIMGGLNYESILRDMPSARRKGRWEVTPVYIKCSECGESFMLIPQNFCPNCGAIMEESDG